MSWVREAPSWENMGSSSNWSSQEIQISQQYHLRAFTQPHHEKGEISVEIICNRSEKTQKYVKAQLTAFDPTYVRLLNPHIYKISLSELLYETKMRMIKYVGQNTEND